MLKSQETAQKEEARIIQVDYSPLLIDQIRAADKTISAIQELILKGELDPNNEHHKAVIETDVYRLRRGLCLPSAASVAINMVYTKRIIGDSEGLLTIGDFYSYLLPHHGKYPTPEQPNGWYVVSPSGDMYHQAIIAFSEACGVPAHSCQGISSLRDFSGVLKSNGSAAISLNNRFVIEQTLSGYPDCVIQKNGETLIKVQSPQGTEFRPFQDGRHVVTLLEINGDFATIADSFNLPQTKNHGLTVVLPIETADTYLHYHDQATSRSIAFLQPGQSLPSNLTSTHMRIPEEVRTSLKKQVTPIVESIIGHSI